jgi:cytochrome c oxidase assembly factor CtaG
MNSLFDFMTHVKGIEYILAILLIAGYILYWEVLKPKPFRALVETGKEDLDHIKKTGYRETLRTIGRVAAAPFIGIFYVVSLPFVFAYAVGSAALSGIFSLFGKSVSFGWRPTEAYLAGKKGGKKEESETKKDEK